MRFIDANIILRYLLDEPGAKEAEKLFKSGEKLYLSDIIYAEIVWTLSSFYKWKKAKVIAILEEFIINRNIVADKKLLYTALSIYRKHNIDYVDAFLVALMRKNKQKELYSFDKDFDKIPGVKRLKP